MKAKQVELTPKPLADRVDSIRKAPESFYKILNELVSKYEELDYINTSKIVILLNDKPMRSNGRRILGKVKPFKKIDKLFHHFDALIILCDAFCSAQPEKIKPLIYHELCHLYVDEEGVLKTQGHDIEEFYYVLKRFGDWKNELNTANQNLLQLSLDLGDSIEKG